MKRFQNTNDIWHSAQTEAPVFDSYPIQDSSLPSQAVPYPLHQSGNIVSQTPSTSQVPTMRSNPAASSRLDDILASQRHLDVVAELNGIMSEVKSWKSEIHDNLALNWDEFGKHYKKNSNSTDSVISHIEKSQLKFINMIETISIRIDNMESKINEVAKEIIISRDIKMGAVSDMKRCISLEIQNCFKSMYQADPPISVLDTAMSTSPTKDAIDIDKSIKLNTSPRKAVHEWKPKAKSKPKIKSVNNEVKTKTKTRLTRSVSAPTSPTLLNSIPPVLVSKPPPSISLQSFTNPYDSQPRDREDNVLNTNILPSNKVVIASKTNNINNVNIEENAQSDLDMFDFPVGTTDIDMDISPKGIKRALGTDSSTCIDIEIKQKMNANTDPDAGNENGLDEDLSLQEYMLRKRMKNASM